MTAKSKLSLKNKTVKALDKNQKINCSLVQTVSFKTTYFEYELLDQSCNENTTYWVVQAGEIYFLTMPWG